MTDKAYSLVAVVPKIKGIAMCSNKQFLKSIRLQATENGYAKEIYNVRIIRLFSLPGFNP